MTHPTRTIHAKTIYLQVTRSLEYGVSTGEVARLGLQREQLLAPDGMVPAARVYAHLELVAARTAIEPFIVELARAHSASALGILGFAIKSAPTLRASQERFRRYQHVTNSLATFEIVEHSAGATFVEHRHGAPTRGHLLATEVSLLTTIHIWRELMKTPISPRSVFIRRHDADAASYAAFCSCPVIGGAERGRFDFDPAVLDIPIPTADAEMAEYFDHVLAGAQRSASAQPPLILDVRRALAQMAADGTPTVTAVARALGLSARTLQRRLHDEDTTFARVLDSVRADLATAHLDNPALSTFEVAYLLGYAEASSFSRAFRRWYGCTPETYRSAHQDRPRR